MERKACGYSPVWSQNAQHDSVTEHEHLSLSCWAAPDFLWPHGLHHSRFFCSPLSLRLCSNSCRLSLWCQQTISSSASPFSFCLPSFPASGSFTMSQIIASGGQSTRAFSFRVSPSNEYFGLISFYQPHCLYYSQTVRSWNTVWEIVKY